jgi:drug/metabolite transporter (DMT)-like permease
MMIRAYQIASAARVSVFEYLILPASALWGWILWDEVLTPVAGIGMALIAVAGLMIARGGVQPAAPSTA